MTEFRDLYGAVYIFENVKAQRVKVGMTINKVASRLEAINDMWLEHKVTCQICGGRRLASISGFIPRHIVSGNECPGGYALPIEKEVSLAEYHLNVLKNRVSGLSSSEKGSAIRLINNLEKRIERYRNYNPPVGEWLFRVAFYTNCAEKVELLSHEILEEYLDKTAPFGEVFGCSVSIATNAVERVLRNLDLLHSVRKEVHE
jgi:hypothetical protein